MHGERGPIARSVTRWRWLLSGESGGWGSAAGVFGSEEWRGFRAAWMDGRVVSYQGRAGSCGSTTWRGTAVGEGWRRWVGEERRGEGGCGGSLVVLAWCYPHQPVGGGGGLGWSICRAVASATHHATSTYTALQRRRRRKEKIVIGDTIVSRKGRGERSRECALSRVESNTLRCVSLISASLRVINGQWSDISNFKKWRNGVNDGKCEDTWREILDTSAKLFQLCKFALHGRTSFRIV